MTNSTRSRLATISEAAETLAVSEKSVRRWLASGVLTGYRFGKTLRVDLSSIDNRRIRP